MSKRRQKSPRSDAVSSFREDLPVLTAAPAGKARSRAVALACLILGINALLPSRWYLGNAIGLETDERFSWRMFSANSLQRTQISVSEVALANGKKVERPVPLSSIVQPGWAEFLQNYHQGAVARKLCERHCRLTEAMEVRYRRTAAWSDGSSAEPWTIVVRCAAADGQ